MSLNRQFCTFFLDGILFGVEVCKVQEIARAQPMTRVPLAAAVVHGLLNLRGQIVIALDLRRRLELPARPGDGRTMNVVVRTANGVNSLLVDAIGDVLEVAADAVEPPPETLTGMARALICGACKLRDRLLLILDIEKVVAVQAGA